MKSVKKIFKHPVEIDDESTIKLPAGAHILSIKEQHNNIVLYAVVPFPIQEDVMKKITIKMVGTGHDIDFDIKDYEFLGTVSLHGGELMFHVFYHDHGYMG